MELNHHQAKSNAALDRFTTWTSGNGFTLAPGFEWRGTGARYTATCPKGHICELNPNTIQQGKSSGCKTCGYAARAKRVQEAALAKFMDSAAERGYALDQPIDWQGIKTGYSATCPEGHKCQLRPDTFNGPRQSQCEQCSYFERGIRGKDSQHVREVFLAWISDNGYTLADGFKWSGVESGYEATCPNGHHCSPWAANVLRGRGGCAGCVGKIWDAFYVVRNPEADTVKFGITSGDSRTRLSNHASDGFTEVLRTWTGLPEGEAFATEREMLNLLKLTGVRPVRGREYFPGPALNTILYMADGFLNPVTVTLV